MSAPRATGGFILRWGEAHLEPETYQRTLAAAAADLEHEVGALASQGTPEASAAARRLAARARWVYARVLLGAVALDRQAAARRVRWWVLLPACVAVLLGILGGQLVASEAGVEPPPLVGTLVFLGVGATLGALMASTPRRILEGEAPGAAWLAVVAVAVTGLVGVAAGGASRWVRLGPLQIQIATLAMPFIGLGLGALAARRRRGQALALLGAALAAMALTADLASALVVAALAVGIASHGEGARRDVPETLALALVGVGLAGLADPILAPSLGSEGVLGLVVQSNFALGVLSFVALGLVAALPWGLWAQARRWRGPGSDPLALAPVVTLSASLLVPIAMAPWVPSVLPLLGYGGSALVASFLGLGAAMALSPRAAGRAPHTASM